MADVVSIAKRAVEIALERYGTYQAAVDAAAQAKLDEVAQRKKRAAYEEVLYAPPDQFPALRGAFDTQFGPDEWFYQERLGLRRQARQE